MRRTPATTSSILCCARRATSAASASHWKPCSPHHRLNQADRRAARRKGPGRTDYLLCVQVGDMPKAMPVAVLEAKKEGDDPLKGMQQARGYADTLRFDVKYVFATNGHRYGEYDRFTELINGPFQFNDFPAHPDLTARYAKDSGIDLTQARSRHAVSGRQPRLVAEPLLSRRSHPCGIRETPARWTDRQASARAAHACHRGRQDDHRHQPACGACAGRATTQARPVLMRSRRVTRTSVHQAQRGLRRQRSHRPDRAGSNAAANARIHIATYHTLGIDDEEGDASFPHRTLRP
jgi:type I restriction enzyme R subunit